jgi:catechol 2,3-dioxygenase-like lactoylglutathione lyase family enzyme
MLENRKLQEAFAGAPIAPALAMEFHRGRLIDHVHLRVRDLDAAKRFYRAVLQAIGKDQGIREGDHFFSADELWIDRADQQVSRVHLAFQARDREAVAAFHAAALAHGGRDNGGPGERHYHPGYYAAFAFDPDGNNIEAVYHGPADVSADSVVIRPRTS